MDDPSDLSQQLRDERTRRREAEHRLAELTERADLWRSRAEERSDRIERLLDAQQRKTNTVRQWLKVFSKDRRADESAPETPPAPTPEPEARHSVPWPSAKAVLVVSAVADPGISRALGIFEERSLAEAADTDLDRADMVVVESAALRVPQLRDRLEEWAQRSARQPLVVWTGGADTSPLGDLDLGDHVTADLAGTFDPAVHRPSGADPTTETLDISAAHSLEVIEKAASGIGFNSSPGAGTAARRWAYRHHAPWVRAHQLMELAGIPGRDHVPGVAAILVSHRPEDIPAAIDSMQRQTHRPMELVVGIHGATMTDDIERALSRVEIATRVLTFDGDTSLGECLNLAAAESTAPLLAKIDDDDHYGPAHLEDSFHALAYSGADIVGKGAHYTYVSEPDTTVLRRPGLEETFIDGSPNGATLVFRREVWDRVGFPHRPRHVDTGFLRAARATAASVYATSRWEFCYVRHPSGHTWDAEGEVFLSGSEPAWDGFHPDRVEVPDVDPA